MSSSWWQFFLRWFESYSQLDVIVMGLANSGKTSFVNAVIGKPFSRNSIPTFSAITTTIYKHINNSNYKLKLIDLGGQRRLLRAEWLKYYRSADSIKPSFCCHNITPFNKDIQALVFVIDVSDKFSLPAARKLFKEVLFDTEADQTPMVVIGNKIDEVTENSTFLGVKLSDIQASQSSTKNRNFLGKFYSNRDQVPDYLADAQPESSGFSIRSSRSISSLRKQLYGRINIFAEFLGLELHPDMSISVKLDESTATTTNASESLQPLTRELDRDFAIFLTSIKEGDDIPDIIDWILGEMDSRP
ncbi:hypothetical protein LJB42_003851 [Komagataella kurtzmanii]|nr:hypothetical protein LJB42_003851 [Komagataella kurtzmanii]